MKIIGLHGGHDAAYAVLENGLPFKHNELERFNREKGCRGDTLKLFLDNESSNDIDYISTNTTGKWKQYFNYNQSTFLKNFSKGKLYIANHHQSHAANAFFTSPFSDALIITLDGGGADFKDGREANWSDLDTYLNSNGIITATTFWKGEDNKITPLEMIDKGNLNIGLYWDVCTYNIFGLNRNPVKRGEEGTVMGMAAYGNPDKYLKYFKNLGNAKLTRHWGPYDMDFLKSEAEKSEQNKFDIAASLQKETELVIKKLIDPYIKKYNPKNICLSGGVSLNCVMTGKLLDWYPGINIFCDPIPHDAGLTLGSCRYVWHQILNNPRIYDNPRNHSPYLGKKYSKGEVMEAINCVSNLKVENVEDDYVVELLLKDNNVISLFGGGSESGRRALGNRSIVADPRNPKMKDIINKKVKHRQWFRPFAPSILKDDVKDWFIHDIDSPYMSFAIPFLGDKVDLVPAVVHNDGTARLQTVKKEDNEWYYNFITKFKEKTQVPIILNTSFNDREPIVETPHHAINCFLRTDIDFLYFRDYGLLLSKKIK
jgi:carbamoyltransferase